MESKSSNTCHFVRFGASGLSKYHRARRELSIDVLYVTRASICVELRPFYCSKRISVPMSDIKPINIFVIFWHTSWSSLGELEKLEKWCAGLLVLTFRLTNKRETAIWQFTICCWYQNNQNVLFLLLWKYNNMKSYKTMIFNKTWNYTKIYKLWNHIKL